MIWFHCSSKRSSPKTSTGRFLGHLFEAFREMRAVMSAATESTGKTPKSKAV